MPLNPGRPNAVVGELSGEDFTLDWDRIIVGKTHEGDSVSTQFYGNLVNFYFDGERLFDRFPSERPVDVRTTASTEPPTPPRPLVPTHPITFPSGYIHRIRISSIQIGGDSRIRFLFRTHDGNGVLLYTSRPGGQFLAVELVNGQLVAVADGKTGPRYTQLITR